MNQTRRAILGPEADDLLDHRCQTISRDVLHLPGPAFIEEVVSGTDRSVRVLRNLRAIFDHGRL
ncbi:MAG: fructose-bisphosphate aldolase, partial [Planctomycetes bacterium]|nr:fructose-bisphosphate aldolase [Planctomycetota bacterium]